MLVVSVEVCREVNPAAGASESLQIAVRDKFGVTPRIVLVETGALAREFEAAVRFPASPTGGSEDSAAAKNWS